MTAQTGMIARARKTLQPGSLVFPHPLGREDFLLMSILINYSIFRQLTSDISSYSDILTFIVGSSLVV
jgi:hypothetical protein